MPRWNLELRTKASFNFFKSRFNDFENFESTSRRGFRSMLKRVVVVRWSYTLTPLSFSRCRSGHRGISHWYMDSTLWTIVEKGLSFRLLSQQSHTRYPRKSSPMPNSRRRGVWLPNLSSWSRGVRYVQNWVSSKVSVSRIEKWVVLLRFTRLLRGDHQSQHQLFKQTRCWSLFLSELPV